jgi:copper homeostasis protein
MILEVCVDDLDGLAAAVEGGADRIELCSALALGGLTPSAGMMAEASGCDVPVMAMIRPRAGGFIWSAAELEAMEHDIMLARVTGMAGVVLGASLPDGRLDGKALARLAGAALGLDLTLHRCFDLVPDMEAALEEAVALGFSRILTSGGAVTAEAGTERLAALIATAAGRIVIMPGARVTAANVGRLLALGTGEVHGSCSVNLAQAGSGVDFGFGPAVERRTDAATVRAVKLAMEAAG